MSVLAIQTGTTGPVPSLRVFHGPSHFADHAAVLVEWTATGSPVLLAEQILAKWAALDRRPLWRDGSTPAGPVPLATVVAAVAVHLQHPHDAESARIHVLDGADSGKPRRVLLGFLDEECTVAVLKTALALGAALLAPDPWDQERAGQWLQRVEEINALVRDRQPDGIARGLMRAALRKGIPVYPVAEGSRIWLYGQGAAGRLFFEAANDLDSITGSKLASNKFWGNLLVTAAGLPGVLHEPVRGVDAALRAAGRLGYPVVVKPADRGKGRGVTANIADADELRAAMARASSVKTSFLLVEKHVDGCDHRLAVFGGRLAWVTGRTPLQIDGDGRSSLLELIARENGRRDRIAAGTAALPAIVADDDMRSELRKQGLVLESVPAAGESVRLRSAANTARGGTMLDLTAEVHPDNRDLAETVARLFGLDAAGIDYITPDISRSWREVPGAVIEVNATPGFFSDSRASRVLDEVFLSPRHGRIPTVVTVDVDSAVVQGVADRLARGGGWLGCCGAGSTRLAGHERGCASDPLHARVASLLLDPRCERLLISATREDLDAYGFPLDRCDLALCPRGLPDPVLALVRRCSAGVVEDADPVRLLERASSHLDSLQGALHRSHPRPAAAREFSDGH